MPINSGLLERRMDRGACSTTGARRSLASPRPCQCRRPCLWPLKRPSFRLTARIFPFDFDYPSILYFRVTSFIPVRWPDVHAGDSNIDMTGYPPRWDPQPRNLPVESSAPWRRSESMTTMSCQCIQVRSRRCTRISSSLNPCIQQSGRRCPLSMRAMPTIRMSQRQALRGLLRTRSRG